MEIKRDYYLNRLVGRMHNHLVKVITGVRRCGKSYLLNTLFKNHLLATGVAEDHIIEMSFDLFRNSAYRDPNLFFPWVTDQLKDNKMYYILLDEVQLLGEFVSVLNDFAARDNCDVYVTGSNAKFLSKDIATEFGGRSIELQMHPLSFSEFMSVYHGNEFYGWNEYMTYGGIPLVVLAEHEDEKKVILQELCKETYLRDIVQRYKIRNKEELDALFNVIASATGSLTNPHKLQCTFKSVCQSKITSPTITKYLEYLKDSFLIEEVKRFNIRGRGYIGSPVKYYFTDFGLRNAQLEFRQIEPTQAMENIIYNELRIRGYQIDVGSLPVVGRNKAGRQERKQLEVDFICHRNSQKFYIQVAYTLSGDGKYEQEIRPYLSIKDVCKKIVITFDTPKAYHTEEGVFVIGLFEFLLNGNSLNF